MGDVVLLGVCDVSGLLTGVDPERSFHFRIVSLLSIDKYRLCLHLDLAAAGATLAANEQSQLCSLSSFTCRVVAARCGYTSST